MDPRMKTLLFWIAYNILIAVISFVLATISPLPSTLLVLVIIVLGLAIVSLNLFLRILGDAILYFMREEMKRGRDQGK